MKNRDHFAMLFWFIVGLCVFGAAFNVFLIIYLPKETSIKMAETGLMFWLSTAVSGGIGYLIGNSAKAQVAGIDGTISQTTETKIVKHEEAPVKKEE